MLGDIKEMHMVTVYPVQNHVIVTTANPPESRRGPKNAMSKRIPRKDHCTTQINRASAPLELLGVALLTGDESRRPLRHSKRDVE